MNLSQRIELMAALGYLIKKPSDRKEKLIRRAISYNPWFTERSINMALDNICRYYLNREELIRWSSGYDCQVKDPKVIGIIMAGNIPAVGFHDMLSVFISGHRCQIKLSDKDKLIIPYFIEELNGITTEVKDYFAVVDRMSEFDAVIATGSNTAGRHFERYFSDIPHIIRKNMNGVAIINKDIDARDLTLLGHDIFDYYGLGCRNVSKLYVENGFDIHRFFNAIVDFSSVIDHNKYKNNYDYNNSLYLINNEAFLTNNFIILKEDSNISSRISSVHYEHYDNLSVLEAKLFLNKNEIQCLVSNMEIEGFENIKFGRTQQPKIDQYADNVDTMKFLTNL